MHRIRKSSLGSRVKVLFYSGYKGQEIPRQIFFDGRSYPVIRVISRERICDSPTGRILDVFCLQLERHIVTVRVDDSGKGELWAIEKRDH